MPQELVEFLSDVPDDVADKIWEWLDSNPTAVHEMIEVILGGHPDLPNRV